VIDQPTLSKKQIVAHLCALAVAGYFLYAAAGKIGHDDTRQFAIEIGNYKILPQAYVNLPAVFMPWWEVAAAISLIIPATRRAGAIVIGAMLLLFIAAVSYSAFYLGLKISCGCTGDGSSQAGWLTIGRNVVLLVGTFSSVYLCAWPAKRQAVGVSPRRSEPSQSTKSLA
jgi:uncharacterized membrane protein YphA (DoxX/SURF4 family)